MYYENKIFIGKSGDEEIYIYPKMANRHGMIAGATGTGKTVTLKVLAESFSDGGIPVFLADVKGDLAGMCRPGTENETVKEWRLWIFCRQAFPSMLTLLISGMFMEKKECLLEPLFQKWDLFCFPGSLD